MGFGFQVRAAGRSPMSSSNAANRAARLHASMPPAVPGSIFVKRNGTNVVLQWQNNFILQSTTNLMVPFTDVLDKLGPVTSGVLTNPIIPIEGFFRLRTSSGGVAGGL